MTVFFFNIKNCPEKKRVVWSPVEIDILKQNHGLISEVQLASAIGKSIVELHKKVLRLGLRISNEITKNEAPQLLTGEKKIGRPRMQIMDRRSIDRTAETGRPKRIDKYRPPKIVQRKYQNRTVDYSQMKSVRIDAKTIIMIRVDQDPEQARELFYKMNQGYCKGKI